MQYHHYGDNPSEEMIDELRRMAREKDLEVRWFKASNTIRIMDTQTKRMVKNNLSFEKAWDFILGYEW